MIAFRFGRPSTELMKEFRADRITEAQVDFSVCYSIQYTMEVVWWYLVSDFGGAARRLAPDSLNLIIDLVKFKFDGFASSNERAA